MVKKKKFVWKEFFRFSLSKVLLFILLIVISFALVYVEEGLTPIVFWPMTLVAEISYFIGIIDTTIFTIGLSIGLPLMLFWLYFLSCLIIHMYEKLKGEKK